MAKEVRLPQLGQTMEEGTFVSILVEEGSQVSKGDVLFEVETDKATLEMESPADGFIKKILVKPGETLEVDAIVAIIGDEDEEIDDVIEASSDASPADEQSSAQAKTPEVSETIKVLTLPRLGQTMEEGTIVNILVKEGDSIAKGDVILEVETDKATLEMESTQEGILKKLLVKSGDTIPVDAPVAIFGKEDDVVSQDYIDSLLSNGADTDSGATTAEAESQSIQAPEGAKVLELPQLGQTMEEGTIVSVLAEVGKTIAKGDVVLEVETDKATLEMESSAEGVVKAILVKAGETIPVDAAVAIVAPADVEITQAYIDSLKNTASSAKVEAKPEPVAPAKPTPVAKPAPVAVAAKAATSSNGKIFASPRAKTIAKELGVNIADIKATKDPLRIREVDVRNYASTAASPAQDESTAIEMPQPEHELGDKVALTRMQKVVAQRMVESKQNIPCFYLNSVVDMTELVSFRAKLNKTAPVKVSFNDFIIRALGLAVKQFPIMAGQIVGDDIKIADNISVGLAIAVEDGLIAPMSKDVDKKSLIEVAQYNKDLIARSKSGQISPDDLSGGCITLSNLGAFGIESFIPIVVPGQCSILGTGWIKDTLVPQNGNILIRKQMKMTLSVDHKVANGAYAAQFLDYVRKLLENPASL